MPDWERYRETFLNGDLKAQNLERLQTMERWLSLPFEQCAAAAQAAFQGQSEDALRPWYRLSRVLYLKLMKDAGFEGPAAAQQLQALYAAYQSGTATPEEFHRAESAVQHRPDQRGTDGTLPGYRAAFTRNAGGKRADGKDRADQRAFDECAYDAGTGECGNG